jgi:hypothetical protein
VPFLTFLSPVHLQISLYDILVSPPPLPSLPHFFVVVVILLLLCVFIDIFFHVCVCVYRIFPLLLWIDIYLGFLQSIVVYTPLQSLRTFIKFVVAFSFTAVIWNVFFFFLPISTARVEIVMGDGWKRLRVGYDGAGSPRLRRFFFFFCFSLPVSTVMVLHRWPLFFFCLFNADNVDGQKSSHALSCLFCCVFCLSLLHVAPTACERLHILFA